jgi:prefoldin subunit 5
MADPESDPSVSVSTEEVRVGKAFEADRFPVPAIAFQIESLAEDPIRIRLVEHIPESFPMEGVGFHPNYDSDNWTAYRDHRVAYERTIDPGESVLTVYGIRIDDPSEADDFLDEPTIELIETDTDPDTGDVLGRETTQVVRDALSGDGDDGLSDLDSGPLLGDPDDPPATEPDADADADTDAIPTPRDPADDLDAAMRDGDTDVTRVDTPDAAAEAESEAENETEVKNEADTEEKAEAPESVHSSAAAESLDPRDTPAAADESAGDDDRDDAAKTDPASEHAADRPTVGTDSVAAALAAEIRADRVDDDDLSVLREALDEASPTSVDARIGRLQSEVADLLAYRDALAGFLDENGTAEEALENVTEELNDLTARVESLDDSLSTAETDRADLRDEVAAITDDVAAVSDRIESLDDSLNELGETVDSLDDRLETVEAFENDIEALRSNIDDLQTFRNRLGDAFGAGQG